MNNEIPVYMLLVDVFTKMITAYYEKGNLITDHRKIFQYYLSNLFLWDLIIIGPFIYGVIFD